MRFSPFTLRDYCWLMLLVAVGCATLVNGQDALRQLAAALAVIVAVCWFVAAG